MEFIAHIKNIADLLTERTENSQALARIAILTTFTILFYIGLPSVFFVAFALTGLSLMWYAWISLQPSVEYRIPTGMILDQTMISYVLWVGGAHEVSIFLLYFWVIIGNGYRFGSQYSLWAFLYSFAAFWVVATFSPFWANHLMYAAQLSLGHTMISLFTFRLLKNLEKAVVDTELMKMKATEAETKSKRDSLTGLCNRESAYDWLNAAATNSSRVGVLFIDLDNFKQFNDEYGHHVGDAVLINISKRILGCVRTGDVACRYAGDEFIVLVCDEDRKTIASVANRISDSLNKPMRIESGKQLTVTGSIGIAVLGMHGNDAHTVMRNADAAMYMAKRLGRNQVAWYEEKIGT